MKLYSCHSLMSTRLFAHQLEETAEILEYIWGTFRTQFQNLVMNLKLKITRFCNWLQSLWLYFL